MTKEGRLVQGRRSMTEIRLNNFKSAVDQRIALSPLTIVVGANSSGKSSLLQSIMALAQASQVAGTKASFPLNGHLTDLGYFSQVRHIAAHAGQNVSIGISVQFTPVNQGPRYAFDTPIARLDRFGDRPWNVDFDIEFRDADDEDPVSARIQALDVRACVDSEEVVSLHVARAARPIEPIKMREVVQFGRVRIEGDVHSRLRGVLSQGGVETRVTGVGLQGGLPTLLVGLEDERRALSEAVLNLMGAFAGFEVPEDEQLPVRWNAHLDRFVAHTTEFLKEWQARGDPGPGLPMFIRQSVNPDLVALSPREFGPLREKVIRRISRGLENRGRVHVPITGQAAALAQVATSGVSRTLATVRHLGGLRIAPQPLYPTSAAAQQAELGKSGEYTAAVLYSLRRRLVHSFDEFGTQERVALEVAVERWAMRLELFQNVTPHHQGALGIDIQVSQPGVEKSLDITAVGLGVSQMLPVLLRCLLSDPGEIILLEQPELHLHPASQQRLADFLLACTRSGRQIIVETHSEHLINRLRLRAAQDETDQVPDLVSLVFVTRDDETGRSEYQSVELNPFGGLSEWPRGFLAEGISDAQVLLDAGLSKMRQRSQ
jgi:predicted ATPase